MPKEVSAPTNTSTYIAAGPIASSTVGGWLMVLFQQLQDKQVTPAPGLVELIVESAEQINAFFVAVDIGQQIDNIKMGLCFQSH